MYVAVDLLGEEGKCEHLSLCPKLTGRDTIANSDAQESLLWAGPRLCCRRCF